MAAIFVVLVAGVMVSTSLYFRAEAAYAETDRARRRVEAERDRALQAEASAIQEAARFKAVSDMLQGVVVALNPERGQARPQGVLAAIDAAAQQLDAGLLTKAPESEVSLRRLLGEVNFTFGRYEEARQHLRRALDLGHAIPEEARAQLLELQYELVFVLTQQGHADQAEALLHEALAQEPDPSSALRPIFLVNKYMLALLRRDVEGMRAAVDAYRQLPTVQYKLERGDDEETALHLARTAYMLMHTGDILETEPDWRRVLDLDRRLYGEDHLLVGYASEWLALVLEAKGQAAEAEGLLHRSLHIKRRALYEDAPTVGFTLANLGRVIAKQGRLDEAERTLRDSIAVLAEGSPEPWMQFEPKSALGSVFCERGEYSEAEPLLLNNYEQMRRDPFIWPDREREALDRIVRLYEAWGKPEKAAEYRAAFSEKGQVGQPRGAEPKAEP
jgi:tetratricopeptide (TPR) repeat protein